MSNNLDLYPVVWWLAVAIAVGGLAVVAGVANRRLSDLILMYLACAFGSATVGALMAAWLASPWRMYFVQVSTYLAYVASAFAVYFGFLTLDAYLATRNNHYDLVRRLLRWWDRRSQRWEDRQRV